MAPSMVERRVAMNGVKASGVTQSVWSRIAGIIRRPGSTFEGIISDPHWVSVLTICLVATTLTGAVVMSTQVGQVALVDQWERTAAAFGHEVDDAGYARLESWSQRGASYAVGAAVIKGPMLTFGLSALAMLLFGRQNRGVSFRQVLTVVAHAGVVLAVWQIIASAVVYFRETTASVTTLGTWVPVLDEASPLARLFGLVDLLVVWWLIVLAIGLSVLFRRRVRATLAACLGTYVAGAVVLAIVMAATGGTN